MKKVLFALFSLVILSCGAPSQTETTTVTTYEVPAQPAAAKTSTPAKRVVQAPAPYEHYRIISSTDKQRLALLVNQSFKEGFYLLEFEVTANQGYVIYTQTLMRRK